MKRALLAVVLAGCTGGLVRDTTLEPFAQTPEQIARGKYLVDAVAACGACHTGRASGNLLDDEDARLYMAGGNTLEDEGNFKLYVPNLTSDSETGLGKWSDDKIARATRDGVDDEGNLLFPVMPFPSYRYMSDADVLAIVAWLHDPQGSSGAAAIRSRDPVHGQMGPAARPPAPRAGKERPVPQPERPHRVRQCSPPALRRPTSPRPTVKIQG